MSEEILVYSAGDFIATDSIFIFTDIDHHKIWRYNLQTGTKDLEFDVAALNIENIQGLECYEGFLYMVFLDKSLKTYLVKFDFDGNLISSVSYPRGRYYLTIASGIIYSQNYHSTLFRTELTSLTDLPEKRTPVYNGEGFCMYRDNFYFIDYDKAVIGYIPLSEIQ